MGVSRDSRKKRRLTGGRKNQKLKKRKNALARPAAATKLGAKSVHSVRTRGGNTKYRGLRLETGNFSWGTESCTRKVKILDVVYNATNNEMVRTKALVKNAIVQVDATPFRQWYEQHYGVHLGKQKKGEVKEKAKQSDRVVRKLAARVKASGAVETHLADVFRSGRLFAAISSRPGQSGRADGYILEGAELQFYLKKMKK